MVLYIWKYKWTGERGVFSRIAVIDNACSVIWTRRYQTAGDFEVYVPASKELLTVLRQNELFITRENDQKNAMKIQKVELSSDPDEGDFLTISGKSCGCIIGQRIVKRTRNLNGKVPDCIYEILTGECIDPLPARNEYFWRKMSVLSIQKNELPDVGNFTMQYYGNNLDALHDCLTDISEKTVVIIKGSDEAEDSVKAYVERFLMMCTDVAEENENIVFFTAE